MVEEIAEKDEIDYGLRELHAVLFEMLSDIDALCRRHKVSYSLYSGTLLGAVREHNFIPWDDDADLMIPIDDYWRFYRLVRRELSEKYVIQNFKNTPQHPWLYTRIYRKGTSFIRWDRATLQIHHGIVVDIFPMIGVANSRLGFKLQLALQTLSSALHRVEFWRVVGYPKQKHIQILAKILSMLPECLRNIFSLWLLHLACPSPKRKAMCCTLDSASFTPKYRSADWNDYIDISLAGKNFVAPKNYDKLLHILYGNYMDRPPLSSRLSHRDLFADFVIDVKRDYTEYLAQRFNERNVEDTKNSALKGDVPQS